MIQFVLGVHCQKQPQPTLKSRIWVKKTYFRKKTIWNSEIWQFREDPRAQNCAITPRILNSLNPQTAQIARDIQRSHGSKETEEIYAELWRKSLSSAEAPLVDNGTALHREGEKWRLNIHIIQPSSWLLFWENTSHVEWKVSSLIYQALVPGAHDDQRCEEHHYNHYLSDFQVTKEQDDYHIKD